MSELYALPEGWEWKKLGDVLSDLKTGTTPPKKQQKYYENPSINWFSPSDFGDHKELRGAKNKINEIAITDKKAKVYEANSLLLVAIGATVGKVGIARDGSSSNQQITAMHFNENIDIDFSYYWLVRIKELIIDTASAATLPIINQKGIKSLPFPLPPLQEQKRIVAKLDSLFAKIDQAITLHQQNIDEAEALMGSVLNEVFGELEGRYEKDKLDNLTSLITKGTTPTTNGYEFQDQGINFLKIENIVNGRIDLSTIETFISEEAHQSQKRSQLEVNDVLFSIAGTIGDTAIVKEKHLPMNTNQAIALIRPIEKLNPEFLRRLLSSSLSNQTTSKKRGGAIKNVSLGDIKNTIIPVPPLKTQQKTVQYLDRLSQQAERLKQVQQEKMQHLKDLKASILDRAFRGEI